MTMRERLEDALYDKASKEQEDILMTFEKPDHLSDKEIKALLKLKNPLESCYNEWLTCDVSYMDGLRDTITDFARDYAKSLDEQKKAKKKHEPER